MNSGNIYHFPNFQTSNENFKNKFIVLLNTPLEEDHPLIFCLTTSQKKHRTDVEFCQPEHKSFLIKSDKDFFPKDTWLIFDTIESRSKQEFLDLYSKKGVQLIGELQNLTIRQIVNCLKRIKQDIKRMYRYHLF